jgi:hypothetical protein
MGDEHVAEFGLRAAVTQVRHDCLSDIYRYGKWVSLKPLASNEDLSGTPVKVAQLQASYLDTSQSQTGQQYENGEVPMSTGLRAVTTGQKRFDLTRCQPGW